MTITAAQVVRGIEFIAQIARVEQRIEPTAMFLLRFAPIPATALALIDLAQPFIDKIVAAAPQVEEAVNSAAPIFEAVNAAAPGILGHVKSALALLRSAPIGTISDQEAMSAVAPLTLGREWTEEEEARWFERASGQQTNQW